MSNNGGFKIMSLDELNAEHAKEATNPPANEQNNLLTDEQVNLTTDEQTAKLGNQLTAQPINKRAKKVTSRPTNREVSKVISQSVAQVSSEPVDPFVRLTIDKLAEPYPVADPKKPEDRELLAGRVPVSVARRFDLICTHLRADAQKQDVLTEALKVYIEHMARKGKKGDF